MAGKIAFFARSFTCHFHLRHHLLFSTTTYVPDPSPVFTFDHDTGSNQPPSSLLVDYLIGSWGFNSADAKAIASGLPTLKTLTKPCGVLNYLRQSGFQDSEIRKLVAWRPKLLVAKVDKTINRNFKLLQDLGFSGSDIRILVSKNWYLLFESFAPSVDFLKTQFSEKERIRKIIWRARFCRSAHLSWAMPRSISLLKKHGVEDRVICKLIELDPSSLLRNPDWLEKHVFKIIKFGCNPGSLMFAHALRTICSMSDSTWTAKVEAFKRFGWSEDDVQLAFRSYPVCFTLSEEHISQKLDFFTNKANYDPSFLSSHAHLLYLSLEKRIIPRYKFCEALNCKKIYKNGRTIAFASAAGLSDADFRRRYVLPYMDLAPDICEVYMNSTQSVPASVGKSN